MPLIRVEDAFLRAIKPGRMGDAATGLLFDPYRVHFDTSAATLTEVILRDDTLDDAHLLTRGHDAMARLRMLGLSTYNMHGPDAKLPQLGRVLAVDQTRADALIRHCGANAARFAEMLALAWEEHPSANILIKTHPKLCAGLRQGHFCPNTSRTCPDSLAALHPDHLRSNKPP